MSVLVSTVVIIAVVLLLNLLLTVGVIRRLNKITKQMGSMDGPPVEGLEPGSLAPDFEATTIDGETVRLADYGRRAVSFVFSSIHCKPCVEKLAELKTLVPKARQAGIDLVMVFTDDHENEVRSYVDQHRVEVPVIIAPFMSNSFARDYRAMGTPFLCVLNPDGEVEYSGLWNDDWEQLTKSW